MSLDVEWMDHKRKTWRRLRVQGQAAGEDASTEATDWRTSITNDIILHHQYKNLCVSLFCFTLQHFSLCLVERENTRAFTLFPITSCNKTSQGDWCGADLEEIILGLFLNNPDLEQRASGAPPLFYSTSPFTCMKECKFSLFLSMWNGGCVVCLPTGFGSTLLLNWLHPLVLLLNVIVVNLGGGGLRGGNDGATPLWSLRSVAVCFGASPTL